MRMHQRQAGRGDQRPEAHEQPRAEAIGHPPRALGQHEHDDRRGQRRQPGLQRVVARDLLQEQHQEEERDAQAAVHRERLGVADREVAPPEQAQRQHRMRRARLPPQERRQQRDPGQRRARRRPATPQPSVGWRISAKTGPASPSAQSAAPRTVDRRARAVARALGHRDHDQHQREEHERDVDGEDPAPGRRVDEVAAAERADDRRDPRPRRPGPDRHAALVAAGRPTTITASALGVSSAPKTPCSARPAISTSIDGASAQTSETAPKPATPIAKTRRSPSRSPSEPPIRISEPSASR